MENCVNCTPQETTPVSPRDCQCVRTAETIGRDIRLLAPTRDEATDWTTNDPVAPEGVLCIVKDRLFEGSREYFIGDGTSKYSELTMLYAGAPLSRTGAENHSPLAASGKSTLDPSWLPDATSSAKGAVMTSTTGAAGKVPIAASGASALDPSWLPAATSTTLGAVKASTTKAANNVVKADANGGLDGWKDSIIDAIIADDGRGGLITDGDGNLAVDFSQMPTNKFEALLKQLKMLIPLDADKDVYVNNTHANKGDSLIDGRGAQNLPFETIQAAVNFVTSTYSLGPHIVTIRVVAGTYNENITLPTYSRTSGYIWILADSGNRDVIVNAVTNSRGTRGTCFAATGGYWSIRHIDARRIENATTQKSQTPSIFSATNAGTVLNIYGCAARQSMPSGVTSLTDSVNYSVSIFKAATGGKLRLYHDPIAGLISTQLPSSGTPSVTVLGINRGGELVIIRDYDEDNTPVTTPNIECSGSCNTFLDMRQDATISTLAGGAMINFVDNGMTGKRYNLETNSHGVAGLAADYFPGNVAGTVDTSTYCWYTV